MFRTLLLEYEANLPRNLRHGAVPNVEEMREAYSGRSAAFLARFADEYGGCVGVRELDSATALLQRLYVQPGHRGHGAARALTEAAIGFARECGYDRIVLDTDARHMHAAVALYRSMGFAECEPYAPVAYPDPTFMQLRLR